MTCKIGFLLHINSVEAQTSCNKCLYGDAEVSRTDLRALERVYGIAEDPVDPVDPTDPIAERMNLSAGGAINDK